VADLTDGSLDWFLAITETGGPDSGFLVFTGTLGDGTAGQTCGDWTQTVGQANAGSPGSTTGGLWTNFNTIPCGFAAPLYCFEQ